MRSINAQHGSNLFSSFCFNEIHRLTDCQEKKKHILLSPGNFADDLVRNRFQVLRVVEPSNSKRTFFLLLLLFVEFMQQSENKIKNDD